MRTHLITAAAASLAFGTIAAGAVSLVGTTFGDSFDSLPSTGTTALNATVGTVNDLPGTDFEGTKLSGTGSTLNLVASDGSANSGALYSFGALNAAERALGAVASGSTITAFGIEVVNNTGSVITSLDIDGFREQWRSSTTNANTIEAQFAVDGTGTINSSNYLTVAGFTDVNSLDLVGDNVVQSNGPLDGNANAQAIGAVLAVTIQPGESFFLRFQDANDVGNDAGLALDGFSLVATLVPEPTSLALLGLAGLSALRRRRA